MELENMDIIDALSASNAMVRKRFINQELDLIDALSVSNTIVHRRFINQELSSQISNDFIIKVDAKLGSIIYLNIQSILSDEDMIGEKLERNIVNMVQQSIIERDVVNIVRQSITNKISVMAETNLLGMLYNAECSVKVYKHVKLEVYKLLIIGLFNPTNSLLWKKLTR